MRRPDQPLLATGRDVYTEIKIDPPGRPMIPRRRIHLAKSAFANYGHADATQADYCIAAKDLLFDTVGAADHRWNSETGEEDPQGSVHRHDTARHKSGCHLVKLRGSCGLIPVQTKNGVAADHPDGGIRVRHQ